jgi:hypothetical protein
MPYSLGRNKSSRSQLARKLSLKALNDMRHGASFSRAARDNGVTPRTIRRYFPHQLVQDHRGGRIRVTKSDRIVRYLQIAGPNGPIDIRARGSKQAIEFAKFSSDVNKLLAGDVKALDRWRGKKIGGVELLTSLPEIKKLAQNDLLPHSFYRSFSGGAA